MNSLKIGDTVVVTKASNASLNLYMKAKKKGMSYIKCPCNAKPTTKCIIQGGFDNRGLLLKMDNGQLTVAYMNDVRKV